MVAAGAVAAHQAEFLLLLLLLLPSTRAARSRGGGIFLLSLLDRRELRVRRERAGAREGVRGPGGGERRAIGVGRAVGLRLCLDLGRAVDASAVHEHYEKEEQRASLDEEQQFLLADEASSNALPC